MPFYSRRSPLKILFFVLVLVLALGAGLWLFLPWDALWDKALHAGFARLPGASASWDRILDAGPLGFTVKNLDVTIKNTRLHVSGARVVLGLSPLVTARLDTAQGAASGDDADRAHTGATGWSPLQVKLFRGRVLTLDGHIDLAGLLPVGPRQAGPLLAGVLEVHADFKGDTWKAYPESGSLELDAGEITLPDGTLVRDLKILAVLAKDAITIRNFELSSPVPLRVRGAARLDRGNFLNTGYEVRGDLFPAGANLSFQRSGRIGELFR